MRDLPLLLTLVVSSGRALTASSHAKRRRSPSVPHEETRSDLRRSLRPCSAAPARVLRSSLLRRPRPGVSVTDSGIPDFDDNDSGAELKKKEILEKELSKLESLEEILHELEEFVDDDDETENDDGDDGDVDWDADDVLWAADSLSELLSTIENEEDNETVGASPSPEAIAISQSAAKQLEEALLQGVVPVTASVGSNVLPGDFGFDPLNLATKDYFKQMQLFLLKLVPPREDYVDEEELPVTLPTRPAALILRDYREAEIRHSRLAMLAAVFWPLQEILDRFVLRDDQFGPLLYGPVTLPYFPLVMMAIMLLLGYLDIYSQAIKELDDLGEAYLPGDCFWDPLRVLQGAPDSMKVRMQERELFNGRAAMLAVLAYIWEETVTHKPLIEIQSNQILFEPAYLVPFVQSWFDTIFSDTVHSSGDLLENLGETTEIVSSLF